MAECLKKSQDDHRSLNHQASYDSIGWLDHQDGFDIEELNMRDFFELDTTEDEQAEMRPAGNNQHVPTESRHQALRAEPQIHLDHVAPPRTIVYDPVGVQHNWNAPNNYNYGGRPAEIPFMASGQYIAPLPGYPFFDAQLPTYVQPLGASFPPPHRSATDVGYSHFSVGPPVSASYPVHNAPDTQLPTHIQPLGASIPPSPVHPVVSSRRNSTSCGRAAPAAYPLANPPVATPTTPSPAPKRTIKLHYQSPAAAEVAQNNRAVVWKAPASDSSIPRTDADRIKYVTRLLDAMTDVTVAQDKTTNPAYKKR